MAQRHEETEATEKSSKQFQIYPSFLEGEKGEVENNIKGNTDDSGNRVDILGSR
jgi:hypothetical protein